MVFFPVLRDHEPDPRMGHEAEPTGVNATKFVIVSGSIFFVVTELACLPAAPVAAVAVCVCVCLYTCAVTESLTVAWPLLCATRYVSQLWIRCSTIPVKTREGSFTGSYSSLVAKLQATKPAHETEEILVRNQPCSRRSPTTPRVRQWSGLTGPCRLRCTQK